VIKSRRMKWAVHVASMREIKANRSFGRDPGADGRIILK
jgi:hypothetical protein